MRPVKGSLVRAYSIANHKEALFEAGLVAAGYDLRPEGIPDPRPGDVLVAWNRKSSNIGAIERFERAGARVFIAENGYIGKDDKGGRLVALALSHHLGKGRSPFGEEDRYKNHNFEIAPWREKGREILILAQRGIGDSKTIEWAYDIQRQVQKISNRPVRVREHPGKKHTPLEPDLLDAHAVITWSSGAGIVAVAFGVPAFYFMPGWLGQYAAKPGLKWLENPFRGDRSSMFRRVGWAQWTDEEIASGKAFRAFEGMQ